jgi:ADP-heptose:LPS heptosyltransferase
MRILFVRLSSFGDVVFALPAAKALRTALPGAHLTWAIEPPLAPLLAGAAYVDDVIPVDTRGWRRAWRAAKTRKEIREFLRRVRGRGMRRDASNDTGPAARLPDSLSEKSPVSLRTRHFDLVVDAQGLFKSALVTFAARSAGRKVGFGWRTATERINCLFTDERVDVDRLSRPHVADQMLALAEHVTGKAGFERTPDVRHLAEKEDPVVDSWLEQMGERRFAVLQPFSSKGEKEWAAADVAAFSRRLATDGIQPVLRWGPGEERRAEALIALSTKSGFSAAVRSIDSKKSEDDAEGPLTVSKKPPSSSSVLPLILAPPTTPASTARLASRAALFVGADTGPTHLAAASGTATLVLFGPTSVERFGPIGPRAAALRESAADYNRFGPEWPADAVHEAACRLLA